MALCELKSCSSWNAKVVKVVIDIVPQEEAIALRTLKGGMTRRRRGKKPEYQSTRTQPVIEKHGENRFTRIESPWTLDFFAIVTPQEPVETLETR